MNIVNELLVYCHSKGYEIRINEAEKKGPSEFTGGDFNYDVQFPDWKGHKEITYSEGKLLYEGRPLFETYTSESSPVPSFDDPNYSRSVSEHFWIAAFDDNQQRVITWRICQGYDEGLYYWSFLEVNGVRFNYDRDLKDEQVDDATQAWLDERAIVAPYLYLIHDKIEKLNRY